MVISSGSTKKADNMYKSFCRDDDVSFFDILKNIMDNGVIDTTIFHSIRIFSETILSDFKKLHDKRTTNSHSPNDPTSLYLKKIDGGDSKRNIKYVPLNPLCKNDKKDEDNKPIKCFRWYDTQPLEKHFIPQLYHIVLDLGVLKPLGINNIKHIRLETDGSINPFTIQKFEQFNLKTGETKTPEEHISDEVDDWSIDLTHRVEVRKALFDGSPIPTQTPNEREIKGVKEEFMKVISDFTHLGFTPNNITAIFRRIDTVIRLRLFDLFVCNSYNIPESKNNHKHSIVYLDTIELRKELENIIEDRNTSFSTEYENPELVHIPKIDNVLSEFINMELVLKNPR